MPAGRARAPRPSASGAASATAPASEAPSGQDSHPAGQRPAPAAVVAPEEALAERVADRLEAIAGAVREQGLSALDHAPAEDELARLIAGAVAGFYARLQGS